MTIQAAVNVLYCFATMVNTTVELDDNYHAGNYHGCPVPPVVYIIVISTHQHTAHTSALIG